MKKVKHTLGDGTVEWVYEDKFDGCIYGFDCEHWTLQDAIRSFDRQVQAYKEFNKSIEQ